MRRLAVQITTTILLTLLSVTALAEALSFHSHDSQSISVSSDSVVQDSAHSEGPASDEHSGACHFGHCQNHLISGSPNVALLSLQDAPYVSKYSALLLSPFIEGLRRPPRA